VRVLGVLLLAAALAAGEWRDIHLATPLTTKVRAAGVLPGQAGWVMAEIEIPEAADGQIGCAAFLADRHGRWFQRQHPGVLRQGQQRLVFPVDAAGWRAEPGGAAWDPSGRNAIVSWGVVLWGTASGRTLRVRLSSGGNSPGPATRMLVVSSAPLVGRTGERSESTFRPEPWPANPFDPRVFRADLVVTAPDGTESRHPACADQPMRFSDRGDRDERHDSAASRFLVRFRPRQPGVHQRRLVWSVENGGERSCALPELQVSGQPWDDYVRVDAADPRFLSCAGGSRPWWPVGLNLQSVTDPRTREEHGSIMRATPDRGVFSYDAYLARLAAVGGDAAEIWLCSWNVGLEWDARWRGYEGLGRYNLFNANRLDAILDNAWSRGIRLVLNLNNHGQFLPGSKESEWESNPYNSDNGGPLSESDAVFSDQVARQAMSDLRRYLAGRYADHPGVVTWKLWSEVDLTSLGIKVIRGHDRRMPLLAGWHSEAAADWRRLDPYGHPVSTHFATTYRNADPEIVSLPGIDLILVDAYHKRGTYTEADSLAGLMTETIFDRRMGLGRHRKPVFATEYGGGWQDSRLGKLQVEHATGAWLALVCGHAGAPMLWWREWVDQFGYWQPYRAIRAFLAGEDLRGPEARSLALTATSPAGPLWARVWARPGRMLAYIQCRTWTTTYAPPSEHAAAQLNCGTVRAGPMAVAWWDADSGQVLRTDRIEHAGGPLILPVPSFRGHIAAKLTRP